MIVEDFYEQYAKELRLELASGHEGTARSILIPEIERPGLSLLGYLKGFSKKSPLLFGSQEIAFLKDLSPSNALEAIKKILFAKTPFVLVSDKLAPPKELIQLCSKEKIPLFCSPLPALPLMSRLHAILLEELAPCLSCHGSFVDIFGIGVLIQGDSAVGKSEAALGLIERGHRLISDDVVLFKKREGMLLEGSGIDVSRHHMEVRGIGIINIARLYGAVCVKEKKSLDIVVKLEVWNDSHFYDRSERKEQTLSLLDIEIPYYILPVKPGRDSVLLLETIALNHRLKILSAIEPKGKKRSWESSI